MAIQQTTTSPPVDSAQANLAGSKSGSPLRTVLFPAAPERETGGMSPEGDLTESPDEGGEGAEVGSTGGGTAPPTPASSSGGNEGVSVDLSDLLPHTQGEDENDSGAVSGGGNDNNEDSASGDDPEIVTPPTPTTTTPSTAPQTENPATVTTVCGYTLRKRTAEQLEAMRPVKRTRRSVTTVETGEVDCIDNRRTVETGTEYHVVWVDGSDPTWLPRDQLIKDGNANLVEILDSYIERYPSREVTFQAFVSRNARAFSAVADNEDNSCLPHAIQMAIEMLGYQEESARLPAIWVEYLQDAIEAKVPLDKGFHKTTQIIRYCTKGVPKCGVELSLETLHNNLFNGDLAGPMAIVRRVLPNEDGVRLLKPGVYIVGAYKRNMRAHCFAMEVTKDEDIIVREDGIDSGIGDQTWLRMIKFIRKVEVQQNVTSDE